MTDNVIRLVVVSAGLSTPSTTTLLADAVADAVTSRSITGAGVPVEVSRIELRDHAHGIADAMLTGFASDATAEALATLAGADALVAVTPTFSASMSGLFKSFFDIVEPDTLRGLPVVIAATGGSERHSLVLDFALRPLFSYLGAVVMPTGVFAATNDFGGSVGAQVSARVQRAATELLDAAVLGSRRPLTPVERPLIPRREAPGTASSGPGTASAAGPRLEVTPFEELLASVRG